MKFLILTILSIALWLCSCNKPNEKFGLDLKEENPYILNINNFSYQRISGSDDVIGEFDQLNHAINEKLQGRTGVCEVYLNTNSTGKPYYLGFLLLTKDKDWKIFNDRGGIRAMLQRQLNYDSKKVVPDTTAIVDSALMNLDTSSVSGPDTQ